MNTRDTLFREVLFRRSVPLWCASQWLATGSGWWGHTCSHKGGQQTNLWRDYRTLPGSLWNSQTSYALQRLCVHIEKMGSPYTVWGQQATTRDILFLVDFTAPQHTHTWSRDHQWEKAGINLPGLSDIVTTGLCASHHKTTSTHMQGHALYLVVYLKSCALSLKACTHGTCATANKAEGASIV